MGTHRRRNPKIPAQLEPLFTWADSHFRRGYPAPRAVARPAVYLFPDRRKELWQHSLVPDRTKRWADSSVFGSAPVYSKRVWSNGPYRTRDCYFLGHILGQGFG